MALTVNVAGAMLVKAGTGSAAALEDVGYTIDGVQITEDVFMSDVPGDANGGTEGPPIDVQYFGQIDRIRLELSKADIAILAKIFPRLVGGTAGSIGTAGALIAGSSTVKYYRLLLHNAAASLQGINGFTRNYLSAIPRGAIEHNQGTKFSRWSLEFECHAVGGVMWNVTTS